MKNIMISVEEEQKLEELCQYAFECARSDDTHTLKILLDSGLNVNLANQDGNTLLMLAAYNGNLNATRLLLQRGADANKLNDKALSPLAGVCFKGYYEIATLLVEYGADVQSKNAMGLSPMNCALMFGRKEFVKLFAKHTGGKLKLNGWQKFCAWLYGVRFAK